MTRRRFDSIRRRLASSSPSVLAPGELALLRGGQQPPVAELADVELERVGRGEPLGRPRGARCPARPLPRSRPRRRRASAGARRPVRRVPDRARIEVAGRPCRTVVSACRARFLEVRRASCRKPLSGANLRRPQPSHDVRSAHVRNRRLQPRPHSRLDRTLAAQALLAAIAERGADAVGYAYRSPGETGPPWSSSSARPPRSCSSTSPSRRTRPSSSCTSATTRRAIPRSPRTTTRSGTGRSSGSTTAIIVNDDELLADARLRARRARMTVDSEAIFALAAHSRSDARALEALDGLDGGGLARRARARAAPRSRAASAARSGSASGATASSSPRPRTRSSVLERYCGLELRKRELAEGTLLALAARARSSGAQRFQPPRLRRARPAAGGARARRSATSACAARARQSTARRAARRSAAAPTTRAVASRTSSAPAPRAAARGRGTGTSPTRRGASRTCGRPATRSASPGRSRRAPAQSANFGRRPSSLRERGALLDGALEPLLARPRRRSRPRAARR